MRRKYKVFFLDKEIAIIKAWSYADMIRKVINHMDKENITCAIDKIFILTEYGWKDCTKIAILK